jgi:hypothetical protein
MKRTKITYTNQSETLIKVLRIENAASYSELQQEFGKSVATQYIEGIPAYHRPIDCTNLISINAKEATILCVGSSYIKATFYTAIKNMKAAKDRLIALRQQYEDSEPKEILI